MIKIIKPGYKVRNIICPNCYAEIEYNTSEILTKTYFEKEPHERLWKEEGESYSTLEYIKCPCCNHEITVGMFIPTENQKWSLKDRVKRFFGRNV